MQTELEKEQNIPDDEAKLKILAFVIWSYTPEKVELWRKFIQFTRISWQIKKEINFTEGSHSVCLNCKHVSSTFIGHIYPVCWECSDNLNKLSSQTKSEHMLFFIQILRIFSHTDKSIQPQLIDLILMHKNHANKISRNSN